MPEPTSYPGVNALLAELLPGVRAVLGSHLVGLYLDGSLACGDFDESSDVDFVAVTDEIVGDDMFGDLQAIHDSLARLDSPWATELEGFYVSRQAIRCYDPAAGPVPNLERGPGERLKWVPLDRGWEVHRHVLRERGIALLGPQPHTLIDPVPAVRLRAAMRFFLSGWAAGLSGEPDRLTRRGWQAYIVLSMARILYTLDRGEVVSKRAAANWARAALGARWAGLIDGAWEGRRDGRRPVSPQEIEETLAFVRYTVRRAEERRSPGQPGSRE